MEKAWEMAEDLIRPYVRKMENFAASGMRKMEAVYCEGIVKGLLIFDSGGEGDLNDWLPDGLSELAEDVFRTWEKGKSESETEAMKKATGLYDE
jgi:hypothetical protein